MKKVLLFLILLATTLNLTSCKKECIINYDGASTTITLNETFELPQMEKEGYIFLGWYKDESYTDGPYETFIPTTTEEVNFYAKWIDVDTFEANKIIDLILNVSVRITRSYCIVQETIFKSYNKQ